MFNLSKNVKVLFCGFTLAAAVQLPLCAESLGFDVRSYNGYGNNPSKPGWGSVGMPHARQSAVIGALPRYVDGSVPDYLDFPNPRNVSNILGNQDEEIEDKNKISYMSIFWGQFITHETTLTPTNRGEPFSILIPDNDTSFTPGGTINMGRSVFASGTGTSVDNPRMQINDTTPFIDASVVYGTQEGTANSLRTFVDGKLKTSDGNLLPKDGNNFVAGDPRVNENVALTSLHTVFMREHNNIADMIRAKAPDWSDEKIYQAARKIVAAEMQAITVNEYLNSFAIKLPSYKGFKGNIDPAMSNEFVTAVFRFGHSQNDDDEFILEKDGTEVEIPLSAVLFTPLLFNADLMDGILRGSAHKLAQKIDLKMVNSVREVTVPFPVVPFNLDLFAIDVQRGRDHGLPDYNTVRQSFGLKRVQKFSDITKDVALQQQLESLYGSVDKIDLFVGMLAEDHVKRKSVGPLLQAMMINQWKKVRDGDRFWYQNDPVFKKNGALAVLGFDVKWINKRFLSTIIDANTGVDRPEIQRDIFIIQNLQ